MAAPVSAQRLTTESTHMETSSSLPEALQKMGVVHEQWNVQRVDLTGVDLKNPTEGLIAQILAGDHTRLKQVYDFRTVCGTIDLVNLYPEMDGLTDLLEKFKAIHDHAKPEIRLILDGEGVFNIYTPEGEKHAIKVVKGSFLIVPADTVHNFELTETRKVIALRIFQDKDGWVPRARVPGKPPG